MIEITVKDFLSQVKECHCEVFDGGQLTHLWDQDDLAYYLEPDEKILIRQNDDDTFTVMFKE